MPFSRAFFRRKALVLAGVLALAIPLGVVAGVGARAAPAVASVLNGGPTILSGEIKSIGVGKCVGYEPGDGATILPETCTGDVDGQQWTMEADGTIRMFGGCLIVESGLLGLDTCRGSTNEQWTAAPVGSGKTLENDGAGECLDAVDKITLELSACSASADEQWTLPASSDIRQTASAVLQLHDSYDPATGLFLNQAGQAASCPGSGGQFGGNCWWWSANALYTEIDFLENAGTSWTGYSSLLRDVSNTYDVICGIQACPTTADDQSGHNFFQNDFADDTANWALSWLDAYELTATPKYLYLAENLWYYITIRNWNFGHMATSGTNPTPSSCGDGGAVGRAGGVFQTGDVPDGTHFQNLGANALYLRLSAWLYLATHGQLAFLDGIRISGGSFGGALQDARWLIGTSASPSPMIDNPDGPIGTAGSHFLFFGSEQGQPAGSSKTTCSEPGKPKETQHLGALFSALADMSQIVSPDVDRAFYRTVGKNLAETALHDTLKTMTPDAGVYSKPPLIDSSGVLSETCVPDDNTKAATFWPDDCDFTDPAVDAWLPGKGIFIRGLFCLSNALVGTAQADSSLGTFIAANAATVWDSDQDTAVTDTGETDLNEFGFFWDVYRPAEVLSYGTQQSATDALIANLGAASATMC